MGLVTLPASGRTLAIMHAMEEEFVWIGAQVQPEEGGQFTPDSLYAQPLIAFESGSGTRTLIDGWFEARGLAVSPVMQLGSIEAIKRMARAGLGYSIVPRMAVEHADDREGLRVQSLTPVLRRQLAIVMRQDKILSKGMTVIIRLLQREHER